MPEELFFFLASLTCILDLPDLPWAFIHDYLSFLTSTSTFLSYHFYSFYISSHCCLSIHHSYHLAARYLSPNIPRRHLSEDYSTNPYPS
jgi:hypothetical protein